MNNSSWVSFHKARKRSSSPNVSAESGPRNRWRESRGSEMLTTWPYPDSSGLATNGRIRMITEGRSHEHRDGCVWCGLCVANVSDEFYSYTDLCTTTI